MGPVSVGDSIVTSRWIRTAVLAGWNRQTRGISVIWGEYSTVYLDFHCFASKKRGVRRPTVAVRLHDGAGRDHGENHDENWASCDCDRGRAGDRETHGGVAGRA